MLNFSSLGSSCRTTKSITSKNPDPNKACIFPFKYQGKEFTDCTTTNNNDIFWCATEVNSKGEYKSGKWGVCPEECLHRGKYLSVYNT